MADTLTEIIMQVPCPRCEAKVDERCKGISGEPLAVAVHSSRAKPVELAYERGYRRGFDDCRGRD